MKRIDTTNKSVDLFGAGKHGFRNGNKAVGINPTEFDADWCNHVQEELANLVEGTGTALDVGDRTQIRAAIQSMIVSAQKAVIINLATFEASVANGEAVYWDSANSRFDEAIADGTTKQNAVGFADVTNSKVYAFGDAVLFAGLTPGARYYLSGAVAGAITTVQPATNVVQVGIAKTATELFIDIDANGGSGIQPGSVQFFAQNTAPTGWLKANGALVSRTTYASLFTSIGTTFGVGDGATTFALPDLRGEFLRGWDDARGVDSGRVFGSAQGDAIRNITGTFIAADDNGATGVFTVLGNGGTEGIGSANSKSIQFNASTVVPTAAENRPRSIALLACIKF